MIDALRANGNLGGWKKLMSFKQVLIISFVII